MPSSAPTRSSGQSTCGQCFILRPPRTKARISTDEQLHLHDQLTALRDRDTAAMLVDACLESLNDIHAGVTMDEDTRTRFAERAYRAELRGGARDLVLDKHVQALLAKRRQGRLFQIVTYVAAVYLGLLAVTTAARLVAQYGAIGAVVASGALLACSLMAKLVFRTKQSGEEAVQAEPLIDADWSNVASKNYPDRSFSETVADSAKLAYIHNAIFTVAILSGVSLITTLTASVIRSVVSLSHLRAVFVALVSLAWASLGNAAVVMVAAGAVTWCMIRTRQAIRRRRALGELREHLRKVSDEAASLASDADLNSAIAQLLEAIDASTTNIARLQVRIQSIRRLIQPDSRVVAQLSSFATTAKDPEVKRLLWSLIDDMARICVLQEEHRLYRQ